MRFTVNNLINRQEASKMEAWFTFTSIGGCIRNKEVLQPEMFRLSPKVLDPWRCGPLHFLLTCLRVFATSEMFPWHRCHSLFCFSDRGILRNGTGPHGYSDAWCFSSWQRYWLDWIALHAYCLLTDCMFVSRCVCLVAFPVSSSLHCLWSSLCFFLFLVCLARSWFIAGVLDVFQSGLFLITFIPEKRTHSARDLHY